MLKALSVRYNVLLLLWSGISSPAEQSCLNFTDLLSGSADLDANLNRFLWPLDDICLHLRFASALLWTGQRGVTRGHICPHIRVSDKAEK